MFEWRVTVRCPVRLVEAGREVADPADHQRVLYVWTDHERAVDAYDEALRVLRGWPDGARPVDVAPLGMYVPVVVAG
jgi:hypothetical protein